MPPMQGHFRAAMESDCPEPDCPACTSRYSDMSSELMISVRLKLGFDCVAPLTTTSAGCAICPYCEFCIPYREQGARLLSASVFFRFFSRALKKKRFCQKNPSAIAQLSGQIRRSNSDNGMFD